MDGMRVVAVRAFDMTCRIDDIFSGIMNAGCGINRVVADFFELCFNIGFSHVPVVTGEAVLLFFGIM